MTTPTVTPTAIQITPSPQPRPQRGDGDTFADRMDLRCDWEDEHLHPEMNAAVAQVNANAIIAANGAAAATVAIAAANFKGLYSALTGAQPTGISCFHLGAFWILSADVADVTTKIPSVATEWKEAKTINELPYFKCTGAVTAGTPVSILADGSVAFPSITNESAGTVSNVDVSAYYTALCYDSTNDKIIAVYRKSYTCVRVGYVSAGVILWGAETQITVSFNSPYYAVCHDPVNNRIVIVSEKYVAVGTVNAGANTISFGTPVSFTASATSTSTQQNICFDPVSGKVIIFTPVVNVPSAFICTVSGTTATFSSPITPPAGAGACHVMAAGGKLIFATGNIGSTANIIYSGVVSGSTINFSATSTLSAAFAYPSLLTYDTVNKKIISINFLTASITATSASIAGDGITVDPGAVTIHSSAANYGSAVFDPVSGRTTVLYGDVGNSNYATIVNAYFDLGVLVASTKTVVVSAAMSWGFGGIVQGGGKMYITHEHYKTRTWTNYSTTATSYIGIAQDTVANNEFTRVAISQYMTENMTGLSLSSKYYVADNGTLTTTPRPTFAGTAVGATRLIVKG